MTKYQYEKVEKLHEFAEALCAFDKLAYSILWSPKYDSRDLTQNELAQYNWAIAQYRSTLDDLGEFVCKWFK
jgi:hypothetical protein